jgi:6-pyruvoyltetrahydropterin/6-carboxytetrahydropterin synthase
MSFEVGVVAHFTARHHLVGDFGPASQEHSHNYRVEVVVSGAQLQQDGTLFDISILQHALSATLNELEGRDLNSIAALAQPNPSAEVVARYIHGRVASSLTELEALTVRVWESDEAFAAYTTALR